MTEHVIDNTWQYDDVIAIACACDFSIISSIHFEKFTSASQCCDSCIVLDIFSILICYNSFYQADSVRKHDINNNK